MRNYTVIRALTLSNKLTFGNCDSLEFLLRISYWYNNTKGKLSALYLGPTVRGIYFSLFHSFPDVSSSWQKAFGNKGLGTRPTTKKN